MTDFTIPMSPEAFGLDPATHCVTVTHTPRQLSQNMYRIKAEGPQVRRGKAQANYLLRPGSAVASNITSIELQVFGSSPMPKESTGHCIIRLNLGVEGHIKTMVSMFTDAYTTTKDEEI